MVPEPRDESGRNGKSEGHEAKEAKSPKPLESPFLKTARRAAKRNAEALRELARH